MSRRNAAVASNLILKKKLNNERGYFGELTDRVKNFGLRNHLRKYDPKVGPVSGS